MDIVLRSFLLFSAIFAVSTALNCTHCVGNGTKCTDKGQSQMCPQGDDGICGRATFSQNGVQKVVEQCTLKTNCIGNIDCLKDGFELGKGYPNATDCVVSCCEGDNCDPAVPLKCHKCQGKGETCKTNSLSCGFKEDRCLRINYKADGVLMTDERCYKASSCSNTTTTCNLVKKSNTTITECEPSCCNTDMCNAIVRPDNSNGMAMPSLVLFMVCFIAVLKI